MPINSFLSVEIDEKSEIACPKKTIWNWGAPFRSRFEACDETYPAAAAALLSIGASSWTPLGMDEERAFSAMALRILRRPSAVAPDVTKITSFPALYTRASPRSQRKRVSI